MDSKIVEYPYVVEMPSAHIKWKLVIWCNDYFGHEWILKIDYVNDKALFKFKEDIDAIRFKMEFANEA